MVTRNGAKPLSAALADGARRRLRAWVAATPMPVHRLAAFFDISRPAVSRHLRVLREAGRVGMRTVGRENVCRLRTAPVRELPAWPHGHTGQRRVAPVAPGGGTRR